MKSKIFIFIKFGILPILFLLFWVNAYKTKSLVIEGDAWNDKGEYKDTFINQEFNLQLTPKIKKILSIKDSVIWDVFSDGKQIYVTTGSEGKAYIFNRDYKLKKQLQLGDKEIVSIIKQGNFIYFGSGPEGKIYRIPVNAETNDKSLTTAWVETGEQFIWDMIVYENDLWVATGGERAKIFRIPLNQKGGENPSNIVPVLVFAEPNALKLELKKKELTKTGATTYLYVAVSTSGKLYRVKVGKGKKKFEKLEVLFDAGEKDVVDFVFIDKVIYLITSGSGKVARGTKPLSTQTLDLNKEAIADGAEEGGLIDTQGFSQAEMNAIAENTYTESKFQNFLVRLTPNREVKFVYFFENKNPMRLVYWKEQKKILVGILENAEIFQIKFTDGTLPNISKIFSHTSANFSDLFLFERHVFFTIANQGDVYQLEEQTTKKGAYFTKVFDFKQTPRWGRIINENHNPGTKVRTLTRSGNTQTPENKSVVSNDDPPLTPVESWSTWEEIENGKIKSPAARFLQVKIELAALSGEKQFNTKAFESASPLIKKIKIFYGEKNSPHRITSFKIFKQDTSLLIPEMEQSLQSISEGMFESYNVDHSLNTVFSTEDKVLVPSIDSSSSMLPFKKIGKKNFVLKWDVQNHDQDTLVYELYYRDYSSTTPSKWKKLKKNYLGNMLLIDGYKFIDGVYQFKIVAKDSLQNPDNETFYADAVTEQQVFDNKSPKIEGIRWDSRKQVLRFKVKDKLSLINSVKYTYDKKTVLKLFPIDGVYDNQSEEFEFILPSGVDEIVLIIKDSADNILYQGLNSKSNDSN